jgi:hypothetical protein
MALPPRASKPHLAPWRERQIALQPVTPPAPAPRKEEPLMAIEIHAAPPCPTCAHLAVCNRTASLRGLEARGKLDLPPLADGVRLVINASVECDAYMELVPIVPLATAAAQPPRKPTAGEVVLGARKKRVVSPQGRAAIAAAAQRRWHPELSAGE